ATAVLRTSAPRAPARDARAVTRVLLTCVSGARARTFWMLVMLMLLLTTLFCTLLTVMLLMTWFCCTRVRGGRGTVPPKRAAYRPRRPRSHAPPRKAWR